MKKNKKLEKALIKKALGFECDEVVEEYGYADGEEVLLKKKVTKKVVPPDFSAVKMLLDKESDNSYVNFTDEELIAEKRRLLNLLKKECKIES